MLYYKVLKDICLFENSKQITLIKDELITVKEANEMKIRTENKTLFAPVNVSSKKTYFLFGARFTK